MSRLSEKSIRCPDCGGHTEIVATTEEYIAVQCVNGHFRRMKKHGYHYVQKIWPVYLIQREEYEHRES